MRKTVFLDRDDTINHDVPYCSSPKDFNLIEGVGEGIKKLNDAGFLVIVVTNQSGIARGYFTESDLSEIHDKMKSDLKEYGAQVDDIFYCPHHPDDNCYDRKPNPGLLEKAAEKYDIDKSSSYIIGDNLKDVQAGKNFGVKTILLSGDKEKESVSISPEYMATDFSEAIQKILFNTSNG